MTPVRLADFLDDLLLEDDVPLTEGEVIGRLPCELREQLQRDPQAQRLLTEWVWLHGRVRELGSPLPSPGFVDRVVEGWRVSRQIPATVDSGFRRNDGEAPAAPHAEGSRARSRRARYGLAWVAVATAVAIVGLLLPRWSERGPSDLPVSTVPLPTVEVVEVEPPLDLAEPLPWLAAAGLLDESSDRYLAGLLGAGWQDARPPADAKAQPSDFEGPPIRAAMQDTTQVVVAATRGLRSSFLPVASSAADAFGFLVPPARAEEAPF